MEIHILGISGAPVFDGNCDKVIMEALSLIGEEEGVKTDFVGLAGKDIRECLHCNWCIKNQTDTLFCVQKDDMIEIYPKFLWADGIIIASPVHIGRLSGILACMIDRLRAFVHGNVHRGRLKNKVGGAIAVAFMRGGGVETTLLSLQAMFYVFDMIVARSRGYQLGAACLTSINGTGKVTKGIRHMAMEDEFGIESVRDLSKRVVELSRIIKAGIKALRT
jgi:multimeric flavodoxin WrbA